MIGDSHGLVTSYIEITALLTCITNDLFLATCLIDSTYQ